MTDVKGAVADAFEAEWEGAAKKTVRVAGPVWFCVRFTDIGTEGL